jgi:hypothetical protein
MARTISSAAPRTNVRNAAAWTYARSHWYSDSIQQILVARPMICNSGRITGHQEASRLPAGPYPFQDNAATIYTIANTGAMLLVGQEHSRVNTALTAGPCCASGSNSHQDTPRPSSSLIEFLTHITTPKGRPLLLATAFRRCRQFHSPRGSKYLAGGNSYPRKSNVRRFLDC